MGVVALCAAAAAHAAPELRTGSFKPPRQAPEFTLQGSNGAPVRLSTYRGKVVALGFGYTSCPDVCPTTLADLAKARKKLGAAAEDVKVIYVTVDPERDNAALLRDYLAAFDPTFLGATGAPGALAEVRKAYGIQTSRAGKPPAYFVHHSSYVYLIDRAGTLRAMMPFGVSVDDMAHDLNVLLASGPSR
ncbi:MAG: SCO family protein [Burkholderiales bacterium]|nr:SCO family protein [Burkholderiales bacterium]